MKKLWNMLSGYKTIIAAAYWLIWVPNMQFFFADEIPPKIKVWSGIFGIFLTITGLSHKSIKKIYDKQEGGN